jgi:peptide/nickel transport system substrate-binding protein
MILIVGCGGHDDEVTPAEKVVPRHDKRGGTIVLGSITDVDSWNEYLSQQSFSASLLRRIYLRLAQPLADRQEHPQSYGPQLAESWEFSDDGLTLTFKLREVDWSDGRPVCAADVRFTWQAQTSPDVPWANAGTKERINDVEVIDDRTVAFHFTDVYPYQLADAVEGGILPEHLFSSIPFEDWTTHDWSTVKVGSGPFLLERHQPGHEIRLKRNARYYKRRFPRLDRVVVRIVPDVGNLLTQLAAGEIDYLEGIPPKDAHRLTSKSGVELITFDYPKYDFVGWNGSRPPFDDPEIRRAMTLAIDRQGLVEELLYGYGQVSKGPLLSFWWNANDDLVAWPYDPGEARRILRELGYATVGRDGRPAGEGRVLEFELITNSGNRLREEMLVKIQEQLSRVGVRATIRPLEMRALRQQVGSGDYDAYLGGWVFDGKADLKQLFASDAVIPNGMNVVFYASEDVDLLLDQVDDTESWDAMKAKLDAIQSRIHEDQPYTFLYETKRVAAHGNQLSGVEIDIPSDPLARLERYSID